MRPTRYILPTIIALLLFSCHEREMINNVVAQCDEFCVGTDSVTQGEWTAVALSRTHIVSNFAPNDTLVHKTEWKIDQINPHYPEVTTPSTLIDALYNMSIDNLLHGVHRGSYSVILALAYLNPQASIKLLKSYVEDGVITQRHYAGMTPIVAIDVSWAAAAWEVYCVTGDKVWLRYAYEVISKTMKQECDINTDCFTGLIHGGVPYTFLDSQFYPDWMEQTDIYETATLSTNVLYLHAYEVLNDMCDELNIESDYGNQVQNFKDAINNAFWNETAGYYNQYTYSVAFPLRATGIDNFGQALSVLWNIADDDRAEHLIANTPISHFGVPVTAPRYQSQERINLSQITSTSCQALWNLAAAKVENENMLRRGLGALYRAQALMCTGKAVFNNITGNPIGNNENDISASTGNIAMIFRIYAGITFLPNGIEFNPFVPVFLKGKKTIKNFRYRNATLHITIEGEGNNIEEFMIDGQSTNDNFVPCDIEGEHNITIKLSRNSRTSQKVTISSRRRASKVSRPVLKLSTLAELDVDTSTDTLSVTYNAAEGGDYFVDLGYSNHSNHCGVVLLNVNSHHQGTFVLPQRDSVGYSNLIHAQLLRGANTIKLVNASSQETPTPLTLRLRRK